jgi:serine/threonine-protein kinase
MLPVGPPSAPHPSLSTGSFPHGPPPQPRRNRTALWILLIVFGVLVLTLAVFGLAALLSGDDTDGSPRSETTSETTDQGDANDDTGNNSGNDDEPTGPQMPIPTDDQQEFVEFDEESYFQIQARYVLKDLTDLGLRANLVDENGEKTTELDTCFVTDVTPDGRVRVGSAVTVTCELEDPPR